eukprot:s1156_g23.t1
MSQGPSSGSDHDEISLALEFQGLRVSVEGPAAPALDFVHHLLPEYQARPAQTSTATASRSASSTVAVDTSECPTRYLALAAKLSAASAHTPLERIKRAWEAGCYAKAELAGEWTPVGSVVDLDLPNNFFVVLRGKDISEPTILRRVQEFRRIAAEEFGQTFVGHGFPSETESRVYIAGAGRSPSA